MARYLGIKKIKTSNDNHYYLVEGKEKGYDDFFIGINPIKKELNFYFSNLLNNPCEIINFNYPEEFLGVKDIPDTILGPLISKVLRALREHNFPDNLDFFS